MDVSRRGFLALAGPGLFVFFGVERVSAYQQEPGRLPTRQTGPADFNAYLRIGADGRVTCFAGKVELGQGCGTVLAQILAEELDVAYGSVDVVLSDTDLCPYDMGTFGSMNVPVLGPALRAAGAEARAVLLQLAAERLGVPADRLQVKAGVVTDPSAPGKQVAYGQLVEGKRIERHLEKVAVKPVKSYAVVGHAAARKDGPEKVGGTAKYAGDFLFPGLLHARLVRAPAHGSKLKDVDTSAAERFGARVVKEGEMVAVLHERPDLADRALGLVKAQFEPPQPSVDDQSIFDHLLKAATRFQPVGRPAGDLAEGEKLAAAIVEQTYLNSYVAHAPMETHTATAVIENGKATVWASTQAPYMLKPQLAQAIGFAPANVRIIAPYVGGGFGGKTAGPQAVEAARLAKATGKPVQVMWNREEEFFFDTFRPAAVVKIRSGLNSAGKIVLWDSSLVGGGDREGRPFYDIPNQRTVSAGGWQGGPPGMHPLDVGAWRAPSANTNTFARESHMDAMAAKAGVDPLEFRLNHLTDARMRRVLETLAKQFGWKAGKGPSGRGVGVACGMYSNAYSATMAEVTVNKSTGHVQVKRLVSALDVGMTLNPDGMRQQMESCITMGLGYALTEEVRFKDGQVLDHNFHTYAIPRFSWLPKIETILVDNPENPPLGGGEPPIITMGAVLANAIYDAAGVRMLQLPMTPERVLGALKKA
jgi:isoquinoline 1-oxidoreductase